MVDPDSSESMDNSRSSRSTSPDTPTSSEGFPAHSPATLPFLNLDADAFHSSRSFKDDLDINAWPILAGDSQLAAPSPPFLFNELSYPFMEPTREIYDMSSIISGDLVVSDIVHPSTSEQALSTAPPSVPASPFIRDASPFAEQPQTPSDGPAGIVINPPKEICSGLSVLFPNLSPNGVKSRVETQIKVVMDLASPFQSSSDSPQRVGSWKWLRLPPGCANGRRLRKNIGKSDAKMEDTLYLGVEIRCVSLPHLLVTACTSCQAREAKRVARKIAARVRPVQSEEEDTQFIPEPVLSTVHLDNLDSGIILFNCAETLDFSTGSVNLPLRITCYCRHHRERIGFCIKLTLRDHTGRIVGSGTTPPIMITDDHKTFCRTNASTDAELETSTQTSGVGLKRVPQSKRKVKTKPYEISRTGTIRQATSVPVDDNQLDLDNSASPSSPIQVPDQTKYNPADTSFRDATSSGLPAAGSSLGLQHTMSHLPMARGVSSSSPRIQRLIPSSGPTHGGIEITVLGSNFSNISDLHITFGGCRSSFTQRWSDNTLVCMLPPRSFPGEVEVGFDGVSPEYGDCEPAIFTYKDESDRALMELALQVVGLKMTGKIEDAKDIAMRIVGTSAPAETSAPEFQVSDIMQLASTPQTNEASIVRLLSLLELAPSSTLSTRTALDKTTSSGQTLLHLSTHARWFSLTSYLISRGADLDARDVNGLTPLHFAVLTSWQAGVDLLLQKGADHQVVDARGRTPLELSPDNNLRFTIGASSPSSCHSDEGDDADIEDESIPAARPFHRTAQFGMLSPQESKTRLTEKRVQEQVKTITSRPEKILDMAPGKDVISRLRAALSFQALESTKNVRWQLPQFSQMTHLPLAHLHQLLGLPDIALSQLPVSLPIYVAIPSLSSIPWPQSSKRGDSKEAEQSELALAGTSWLAYMSQALNRSGEPAEPPPQYSETPSKVIAESRATPSTSRSAKRVDPAPSATTVIHGPADAEGPLSKVRQDDRMLFFFWLPILLAGFIWGVLTSVSTISRLWRIFV